MKRLIMHVDMDAFFASVEQRDNPEYRGKPVIVGGLSARGVVATASYEARRFGVHSAMPMSRAKRLCPQGIFLPGNHAHYAAVSDGLFGIFSRFSPLVEPLSIDEAFLDLSGMELLMGSPQEYAGRLKAEIKKETGLIASVGVAPNKFLAKLASDYQKPDGLVVIEESRVDDFLLPLSVGQLWGVGKKTAARLEMLGCRTVAELRRLAPAQLKKVLGSEKLSLQLLNLANGIDERRVEPVREAQSIGRERTFEADIFDREEVEAALRLLAEEVGWRIRKAQKKAGTVQLKVRTADFATFTRQRKVAAAVCYDDEIYEIARRLYQELAPKGGIRLLGITGSGFDEPRELDLFASEEVEPKKERLYDTIDELKRRFGERIIGKARH